jgi:hypothetical protein
MTLLLASLLILILRFILLVTVVSCLDSALVTYNEKPLKMFYFGSYYGQLFRFGISYV